MFLFTSLDKCCGDGLFSSDNGSFFWEYIGVGTLVDDLFEWSSSVGFSVAQKKNIWKGKIRQITDDKLILKKIT